MTDSAGKDRSRTPSLISVAAPEDSDAAPVEARDEWAVEESAVAGAALDTTPVNAATDQRADVTAVEPAPDGVDEEVSDREISRLDTLLARITKRTEETPPPSNDNATGALGAATTIDAPAGDLTNVPQGEGAPDDSAPDDSANEPTRPAAAIDEAELLPPHADAKAAIEDSFDEPPDVELVPADRPVGSGDPLEAEEESVSSTDWPARWGPPSGQNVLRVLSELLADLDARGVGADEEDSSARTHDGKSRPADGGAMPGAPASGSVSLTETAPPPPPEIIAPPDEGPPVVPSRPVFGSSLDYVGPDRQVPVARSASLVGRGPAARIPRESIQAPVAAPDRSQAQDPTPALSRPVEPQLLGPTLSAPAGRAPAARAKAAHETSPWLLEQPEFRRAFGRAVALTAPEPIAEPELPPPPVTIAAPPPPVSDGTSRRKWMLRLIAIAAGVVVFAGSAWLVYETRATIAGVGVPSVPAAPDAERIDTGEGAALAPPQSGAASLLPSPVLPLGADTPASARIVVEPVGGAALEQYSAFSGIPNGAEGNAPEIHIEKTEVRSSSSTSTRGLSGADAENAIATSLIAEYRVDDAKQLLDEILGREPDHFGSLVNRGRLNLLRDDFAGAEADFVKARAVRPQSVAAALGHAEALLSQRRGADALQIVEAAIAANPDDVAAYDLRARAHAQIGATDMIAVDCAELSWKLGHGFVGSWCEAMAWKDAGRTEESIDAFNAAFAEASEDFIRHRQLYLRFRGHYEGPVDGQTGPATKTALAACAADPNC